MKYLCLVHAEVALLDALSKDASAALAAETTALEDELASRGQLVVAHALQRANRAKVVELRQGRVSQREGSFVQAKEPLRGFLLIEADDLNEAIRIASKVPLARLGHVEVRPIARVDRMEVSA